MAGRSINIAAGRGASFRARVATPDGGKGPALVLLREVVGTDAEVEGLADRFAAEGYVVVVPDLLRHGRAGAAPAYVAAGGPAVRDFEERLDCDAAIRDLDRTIRAVRALPRVTGGVGVIGFGIGGRLALCAAALLKPDVVVAYGPSRIEPQRGKAAAIRCPLLVHIAAADGAMTAAATAPIRRLAATLPTVESFTYAGQKRGFAEPGHPAYDRAAAGIAMSRTIAVLRRAIGPRYDLDALWDRHTFLEFGARDVAATMRTMVRSPYVNHIPVLTGGVGHADLARFYKYHFIPRCPRDTKLVPVSRTVGADRVVDEMLFCFTHDIEIDWMLPGIAPTGKYVEVPLVAIVAFRGSKLYHEHIYWDQASVLVQIGRLDPHGLPVAGHAQARKLLDEALPSNELMASWPQSAGKAAP